jgi:hypothetical protein
MNAANAMTSILAGSAAGLPMSHGPQSLNGQVLSQDSMAVVSGLVESFMHKVKLHPGERACLENNVGQLTGDVMGTVGDIVTAIKALVSGKGSINKDATGGVVSAGLDSAMKITSLITLSTQLVKNCVHGDALSFLNRTAHNLINGTYLEHQFLVNGVDVAHDLADSVMAFESHDFHRFGADIGISLRKILLSNNTNATRLPEGVPEQAIIQKCTDGLMKGFFVRGTAVEITDTAHPDVDIVINLHQCIAGNSEFFKELWMAAWDLIAKLSANGAQHGLDIFQQQAGDAQPKWAGELMVAMMQFPMAITKCGVSQDVQQMFMEAIQSLSSLKVKFSIPGSQHMDQGTWQADAKESTEKMAKAVEAWTNWDFEGFGYELGKLLRDLVMTAFPQKYSIDDQKDYAKIQADSVIAGQKSGSLSSSVIIGGAAVSMLVAFTVLRARRSPVPQMLIHREALQVSDLEDAATDALVE